MNYLIVIGTNQLVLIPLFQLLPLLVQSLHSQQVALLLSTLNTLNDLIAEMPDMFTRHVDDFLPRLLDLTQFRPKMVGHDLTRYQANIADHDLTQYRPNMVGHDLTQ